MQYHCKAQEFSANVVDWGNEKLIVSQVIGGELYADIDFDKLINSSALYTNKGTGNFARLLDVRSLIGQTIVVTPNSLQPAIIAFLASDDISTKYPRFCISEYERHTVSIGSSSSFIIPKDCKYLYVVVENNSQDATPSIVVSSVENNLVDDAENLKNKISDNIVHSLSWFQNALDNNHGHVSNTVNNERLYSYFKVVGGTKIHYNLSGMYRVSFTIWDGVTLPVPSSTGWLTDKGVINISNDCIVYIAVSDIRTNISITTDIFSNEDIIIKLWNEDRKNIESLLQPQIKLIPYGAKQDLTPDLNNTGSRITNSSCYLKRDIGSVIRIKVNDGYQFLIKDFNDGKSLISATGWLTETDHVVTNGNILFIFRKSNDSSITVADVENNMSVEYFDEEYYNEVLTLLANDRFADVPDNTFPVNWKQGIVTDTGPKIGQITSAYDRICDIVDITKYSASKIWYFVDNGYKVYFRGWDGVTNPMPASTGWLTGYGEYTIPNDAQYVVFGASKTASNTAIIPSDGLHIHLFTNKEVYELFVENNRLSKPYKYSGERICIENGFNALLYKKFQDWSNMQGGAVYDDKLVCLMATDELNSPSVNGFIYDLHTGEKLNELLFDSTIGSKTYTMPHANQVSFGTDFYNENSRFPLLYVSQVNGSNSTLWNASERGVLVYDLQTQDDGETYTPVLVQAIIPDLTDTTLMSKLGKYTPNYIVDTDNNQFIILGYPNASWSSLTGPQPVAIMEIPSINEGTEVIFTNEDIVDNYTLPVSYVIQQSIYYKGKVYNLCGTEDDGSLRVIDLSKKEVVNNVDLSQWDTGEPQFLGYWKKKLLYYMAGTSGNVYELIF